MPGCFQHVWVKNIQYTRRKKYKPIEVLMVIEMER